MFARLSVTSPEVPPPESPVPAVTPVISPGLGAIQARPEVVAESIDRIYPLVEAGVTEKGVEAALAPSSAPLPDRTDLSIKFDVSGATFTQAEPV